MSEAKVTAKRVLAALRKRYAPEPVIREVVLADPVERAIYNRFRIDVYGRTVERRIEKLGEPIADVVPEGWNPAAAKFERRIDALLLEKNRRTAIEIKVTRADFKRETPEKRRAWIDHTHRFYYAAPLGLLDPDEMPDGVGLLVFEPERFGRYAGEHGITTAKQAKVRKEPLELPPHVLRAMFFRVSNYEAKAEALAAA